MSHVVSRLLRRAVVVLAVGVALAAGGPRVGATAPPPTDPNAAADTDQPVTSNVFIPPDRDLSDCVGSLERPDCGSSAKGGYQTYLAFTAMAGGLAFIGWRIARGVKARDADPEPEPDPQPDPQSDPGLEPDPVTAASDPVSTAER